VFPGYGFTKVFAISYPVCVLVLVKKERAASAMSLPRPPSIFDTIEPTHMDGIKRQREMSMSGPVAAAPDVTTCSPDEFEHWLENLQVADFSNAALQAWMKLSTAATKAHLEYTREVHARTDISPKEKNKAVFRSATCDDEESAQFCSLGSERDEQNDWHRAQQELASKMEKALTLVSRAERVRAKMSGGVV